MREPNWKMLHQLKEMYHGVYLDRCDYTIRGLELANGYASKAFILNEDRLFYMAPTISPCEWTDQAPDYLEHPLSCFDYYQSRGIDTLIGEEKYMGSRAYILAFKNPEHARAAGFSSPIIINSRGGFPFFQDDDERLIKIWEELSSRMITEFIILDAEILPWSLKAGGLLKYQFQIPGECASLSRSFCGIDSGTSNEFLSTVAFYGREMPLEIRPFHILAFGDCDLGRGFKFKNYVNGFFLPHDKHLEIISSLSSMDANASIRPCNGHVVSLESKESKNASIEKWEKYCSDERGEGFVYKPQSFINTSGNGYYIQPAMKVRGKRYLQIVYGIDYRDPEYFEILKVRGVKRKRVMAAQEFDLSLKILSSFLARNEQMRKRLVAAFLGMENVSFRGVDQTL